jgi:putative ABC transport system permease protein
MLATAPGPGPALPRRAAPASYAEPLARVASSGLMWSAMAHVAIRMLFHDKLKTAGSVFGVVFALLLANENISLLTYVVHRNTMYVEEVNADLWIVPRGTKTLTGSGRLQIASVQQAQGHPDVEWAAPIIFGITQLRLPDGGTAETTLVGVKTPELRGGPWSMVAGTPSDLLLPDAVVFEDTWREIYGNLNLNDVREMNGHRVVARGFTWGLLTFLPPYSFAEYDLAREILHFDSDQLSYVLVKLKKGANVNATQRDLQLRVPEAKVLRSEELYHSISNYVLFEQGVGPMLGSAAFLAILVALAIVSLTMLSSVLDNLREFGTFKAIGATNRDLMKILVVKSLMISFLGSIVAIILIAGMVTAARSPQVVMPIRLPVLAGSIVMITIVCIIGASLALLRIRKVEPAMVFR